MAETVYTLAEVAERLKVNDDTVRRMFISDCDRDGGSKDRRDNERKVVVLLGGADPVVNRLRQP